MGRGASPFGLGFDRMKIAHHNITIEVKLEIQTRCFIFVVHYFLPKSHNMKALRFTCKHVV